MFQGSDIVGITVILLLSCMRRPETCMPKAIYRAVLRTVQGGLLILLSWHASSPHFSDALSTCPVYLLDMDLKAFTAV